MTGKRWDYVTPGIPDAYLKKNGVPMTKEEVRCLTVCKARLKSDSIVYDIGAGTGSIAIEAALLARQGMVYAIEKNSQAAELVLKNTRWFGVNNLSVIQGEAPEALRGLPSADSIIIGGSGGRLKEILCCAAGKLKEKGRIIINSVTIETLSISVGVLEELGFKEVDVVSLTVAKVKRAGQAKVWKGMNPVFIVVGE